MLHHTQENRICATLAESDKDSAQLKPACVAKLVRWGASALWSVSPPIWRPACGLQSPEQIEVVNADLA